MQFCDFSNETFSAVQNEIWYFSLTLTDCRKTFGWITFIINLLLYLAFLLPFTALAVYLKINICELCTYSFCNNENQIPENESVSDGALELVFFFNYLAVAFIHRRR